MYKSIITPKLELLLEIVAVDNCTPERYGNVALAQVIDFPTPPEPVVA